MHALTRAELYYVELLAMRKVIGSAEEWAYRHLLGFAGGPRTLHPGGMQHAAAKPAHPAAVPPVIAPKAPVAATHLPTMGTLHKIWPKVKLTPSIEVGFRAVDPYLPPSVVMTSGLRSDEDQIRIINTYFAEHKGPEEIKDVEERRLWLKGQGMIIAKVGSSPHRTGLAFDLSGASIDAIKASVDRCAAEHPDLFPLKNTIVERKQNCLHVNLIR